MIVYLKIQNPKSGRFSYQSLFGDCVFLIDPWVIHLCRIAADASDTSLRVVGYHGYSAMSIEVYQSNGTKQAMYEPRPFVGNDSPPVLIVATSLKAMGVDGMTNWEHTSILWDK